MAAYKTRAARKKRRKKGVIKEDSVFWDGKKMGNKRYAKGKRFAGHRNTGPFIKD